MNKMSTLEPLEFELTDIFDEISEDRKGKPIKPVNPVITSNIEYILKREKLWSSSFKIKIGFGYVKADSHEITGSYQYDYSVRDAMNHEIACGVAYGVGELVKRPNEDVFIILDMTLEVIKYDLDRLRGKTKVMFT